MKWRARDHHWARSAAALILTTPLVVVWGIAAARWLPFDLQATFAIGYLGPFLAWPVVCLALLLTRSPWRTLAWGGGGLAIGGLLAWVG